MLAACQPARRPDTTPRTPDTVPRRPAPQTPIAPDDVRRPDNDMTSPRRPQNDMGNNENDLAERADRIADNVAEMPEIKSATVVISNRTALVGVDMTKDTKGEIASDLKNRIENEVERTDRNIDRVVVTADADTFTRLRNMGREIRKGRPISGFAREIEEIIRRISPTM